MTGSKETPRSSKHKPLLLIDIDGALCPLGDFAQVSPHSVERRVGGMRVDIDDRNPGRMKVLSELFEMVWASTWEDSSNSVGALHNMPELPHISVNCYRGDLTTQVKNRKLLPVAEYVGKRPFVWIDDQFTPGVGKYFTEAGVPHLLIHTKKNVGITDSHMLAMIEFARSH